MEIHNCHKNAYCNDTMTGFTCTCSTGYTGNGFEVTPKLSVALTEQIGCTFTHQRPVIDSVSTTKENTLVIHGSHFMNSDGLDGRLFVNGVVKNNANFSIDIVELYMTTRIDTQHILHIVTDGGESNRVTIYPTQQTTTIPYKPTTQPYITITNNDMERINSRSYRRTKKTLKTTIQTTITKTQTPSPTTQTKTIKIFTTKATTTQTTQTTTTKITTTQTTTTQTTTIYTTTTKTPTTQKITTHTTTTQPTTKTNTTTTTQTATTKTTTPTTTTLKSATAKIISTTKKTKATTGVKPSITTTNSITGSSQMNSFTITVTLLDGTIPSNVNIDIVTGINQPSDDVAIPDPNAFQLDFDEFTNDYDVEIISDVPKNYTQNIAEQHHGTKEIVTTINNPTITTKQRYIL